MSNSIDQNSKPVEVAILIVVITSVVGVFTAPAIIFAMGVSAILLNTAK